MSLCVRHAILGLAAVLATTLASSADTMRRRHAQRIETEAARPLGEPLMAIVSLSNQRVTIYDANGWILRAPVSSGQQGYETPAGIYSILQKEEEHHSNLYDDASMPYMQRITWSGIALHAGPLPGYPASHGCIRMPFDFAQRLFDVTKIGMRVIVARNDIQPFEIDHPVLFQPKLVPSDATLKVLTGYWNDASPLVSSPGIDGASLANPTEPLVTLKSIAQAKMAAVDAATQKAVAARLAAAKLSLEAARTVRAAQAAKDRAEAQVRAAESTIDGTTSPAAIQAAGEEKTEALARLADAEAKLATAQEEAPLKAEAAAHAREEAIAAEAEKAAAVEVSAAVNRIMTPVSIFISRKTQRLYVRQSFQPVLESVVTIHDASRPIGTHVYTAVGYANGEDHLRWSAVSLGENPDRRLDDQNRKPSHGGQHTAGLMPTDAAPAMAALDRIEIPQDIIDRVSEVISPGSSLIISDEGMSTETGEDTDFVILMSGESQGGLKMRRHNPEAHEHYHHRYSEHPYWRSPAYAPSYDGGVPFFVPW